MIYSGSQQDVVSNKGQESFRADRPARQHVAMHVKELIRTRGLRPGDALPSYFELREELAVSYMTVKRGMDDLVAEGIIRQQHGRGTFVAKELALIPRELNHVGVIYPASRESIYRSSYLIEIMRGIAQKAPPRADTHMFSLRQDGMVSAAQLGEWDVSGVILLDLDNDDYLRAFAQWGTPGVVVDYCSQAAPLDYVACDNRAAARQVVAHLAALGHRRVVYATVNPQRLVRPPGNEEAILLARESSDVRERRDESVDALRERDMLAGVWNLGESGLGLTPFGAAELHRRRRDADRPTAVLAENNYTALGLLAEFASRGLHAPEDVSVCAVASDGAALIDGRRLTCCRFDFLGMGRKAIDILAARCREPGLDKPRVHRIGFEFMEGETVGRVKT